MGANVVTASSAEEISSASTCGRRAGVKNVAARESASVRQSSAATSRKLESVIDVTE